MSRILSVPKVLAWGTLLFLLAGALPAQESEAETEPAFSMGLFAALGTETVDQVNYQYLSLLPDFGYGPWGVGIDFSFHFRFYEDPAGDFGIYPRAKDWWDSELSFNKNFDKYLARLAYVRYGKKGDPLYAQLGWIPSTTFGTGFIVSGYNNGALRPGIKLTGLNLDASGSLIDVPWIGVESFVGNVTTFDLEGFRVHAKPFGLLVPDNPILKETEVGFTAVLDTNPYSNVTTGDKGSGTVVVTGVDALAPLYSSPAFTSRATLDITAEGGNAGASIGVDGTVIQFISWGLQNRFLGANFLPNYFDRGYEISRVAKYLIYKGDVDVPGTIGWQASLGTSVLGDAVVAGFTFAGPWGSVKNVLAQPQLTGYAQVKPGLLPVDLSAFYLKNGVTSFGKLFNPEDALIGAKVGYTFGVVTLTVVYDLHYDPVGAYGKPWVTTSRVETAVKMF